MEAPSVPEGYSPLGRSSPYLDLIGPFYSRGSAEDFGVGLRIEAKHTNARGVAHGGVLATMADIATGYTIAASKNAPRSLVTTNLSIDYVGAAGEGDWVESRTDIQKIGSRLAFANTYLSVGSTRIVRASAVFLVVDR
ncbi:MAG: PaaI family thioesterase [Burkholderiales bacterium]